MLIQVLKYVINPDLILLPPDSVLMQVVRPKNSFRLWDSEESCFEYEPKLNECCNSSPRQ